MTSLTPDAKYVHVPMQGYVYVGENPFGELVKVPQKILDAKLKRANTYLIYFSMMNKEMFYNPYEGDPKYSYWNATKSFLEGVFFGIKDLRELPWSNKDNFVEASHNKFVGNTQNDCVISASWPEVYKYDL